ncbi:esterase-like activity of phytase family protein [Marivivens donghaensis]|uniref:esterase-like activity of phytase family protein n=1 Tax=Marivivens donghaensis TaxID=1699413 RepID=UPI00201E9A46|nr:esterase-like activity of phytase family protein [Marivivens donghaensis]MCL7407423.1 esterase-like activity of phytase family protein [Marivivens donghaensis]MDN3704598.1 esterase-like activity of phytase family protein [Marivivens donghaensis]
MTFKSVCITSILALAAGQASAEMNFNRIASFATPHNNADASAESSAEIIAASDDGMTLIYTDSPLGVVGLIDITDATNPQAKGKVDVGGEPTSVTVVGNTAYVAVNTSESYTNPSGKLVSVNLSDGSVTGECDLGGQPDSTAHTHAGDMVTVAIENERDEDLGDGRVGQMPAGYMVTVGLSGDALACDSLVKIDVSGLSDIAPEDPEPEFVDVNSLGEIAVTMQENNSIVILNADGSVQNEFSAGSVDLVNIDATDERGALIFNESQPGRLREPDGLQWIDDNHVMIANEGDMDGGSRSVTVFHKDGTLVWESGNAFETPIIQAGHYPDKRSDAKGVEPEGMEVATFGDTTYAFILSERASTITVYDVTDATNPVFKQVLPSGISPEGAIAIPERGLLATANEVDLGEDGAARAHVMIYELQDAPAAYPQLTSEGADELIGWGAISGMVADEDGMIYAVNDSFYGYQPRIFTIDPSQTPARIIAATDVTRAGYPAQKMDMEGITLDGEGGFWIASEGRTDRLVPHAIYHVKANGQIKEEIALPAELLAVEKRFGFEGITLVGDTLWMAVQREWADDDKGFVKLVSYNTTTEEWGAVRYPLDAVKTGWIGLSEIQAHGDYVYLIERDNQIGENAVVKQVTRVALSEMVPAPLGGDLPVVTKEVVYDLIPDLASNGGYVVDKIEGMAIMQDGTTWMSTDNDGVDDSSGETFFWSIGQF